MIVFFVGTPGSGKSYEAVKKIIDNLRLGRVVCTNIEGMDEPKHQEYIKAILDMGDYEFNRRFIFLTKSDAIQFWKTKRVTKTLYLPNGGEETSDHDELICPKGSLIVIDEAHKLFNCHDWRSDANRALADWASTHRHEGYDLIMITQDIDKVEKQVRSLTEWSYLYRQVNFLGSVVKRKYLCYSYTGDDHKGPSLSKNVRTYDPKYFPCYKSYSTEDAKEVGFMAHANILRHPIFYAIPVVIAFCIWMVSKSSLATGDLFGTDKKLNQTQLQVDQMRKKNIPVASSVSPPSPPAVIQPQMSSVVSSVPVTDASYLSPPPLTPSWRTYPVQGFVRDGLRTFYLVHGVIFNQSKCRNYDAVMKTVECFTTDLTPQHSPGHVSSGGTSLPIDAPSSKSSSSGLHSGEMYATRSIPGSDKHFREKVE